MNEVMPREPGMAEAANRELRMIDPKPPTGMTTMG